MIINNDYKDLTLAAILEIAHLIRFDFYVCGSRFFGDFKPDSDYDFVIQEVFAYGLIEILDKSGWLLSMNPYLDENTIGVWQKNNVQVIIIHSWERRQMAMNHIMTNGLDRHNHEEWDKYYASHPLVNQI